MRRNPPEPPDQELVIWFHQEPEPHFHLQLGAAEGVLSPEIAWNVVTQLIATMAEYGVLPEG